MGRDLDDMSPAVRAAFEFIERQRRGRRITIHIDCNVVESSFRWEVPDVAEGVERSLEQAARVAAATAFRRKYSGASA